MTTGKRAPTLPNLPTVAETVPGYEPLVWYGLLAPAGTPPAILRKLHSEIVAFARRPDITKRFAELEYAPRATSPEEFSVALAAETAGHHPDWSNSYNKVSVALSTHSAGGVTDKDVALARAIDALL